MNESMQPHPRKSSGIPVIGITAGDPGGIGPEVVAKALENLKNSGRTGKKGSLPWDFIPVILGDSLFFESFLSNNHDLFKILKKFDLGKMAGALEVLLRSGRGIFLDLGNSLEHKTIGKSTDENARASYSYFRTAVELDQKGFLDGIVTGPVNKGAINGAGIPFVGHTEEFIRLISDREPVRPYMLMHSHVINVILLTTHHPVRDIEKILSPDHSYEAVQAAAAFLRMIHKKEPLIAFLGIDPHVGDKGAIGTIDHTFSIPLIQEMNKRGLAVEGPFAADSFFSKKNLEKYNLIISAYHDQGLIPFKMLSFGKGVNVTLNLPLRRTSPDHGTAYELAGTGSADAGSMVEAIQLCRLWIRAEKSNPVIGQSE